MDDLLDLDLSSTSSQPQKPSNATYGKSAFDYLASTTAQRTHSATPSPLPSRSASPFASLAPPSNGLRAPSPTSPSSLGFNGARATTPTSASGGDAFASLFGASPSTSSNGATMSMAERLAKESSAKFGGSSGWTALPPSRSSSPAVSVPSRGNSLHAPAGSALQPATSDPWGNFDLLGTASTSPSTASKPANPSTSSSDPFDAFASFGSPVTQAAPARTPTPSFNVLDDSEDGFEGGKEEGLLRLDSSNTSRTDLDGDDFDFLGDLAKPVAAMSISRSAASSPSAPPPSLNPSRRTAPPNSSSRSHSPPPHILGQLVEMGFSIQQAKLALAATLTETGDWNVSAAAEVLLEQTGEQDHRQEASRQRDEPERRRRPVEDSHRRAHSLEDDPVLAPRPGRRAREAAQKAQEAEEQLSASKVQAQAAELLGQASKTATKIGFSVFKSANAYWESGRAVVQKALDEGLTEPSSGGEGEGRSARRNGKGREAPSTGAAKGRPKWMTNDMLAGEPADEIPQPSSSRASGRRSPAPPEAPTPPLFQDSDEEDPVLPRRPEPRKAEPARRPPPPSEQQQQRPVEAAPSSEYRSPWRRAKSATASSPAPTPPPHASRPPLPLAPKPAPKPARPPRPSVPVSSQQMSTSTAHKLKGNEMFKLGRFGDAEQLYTAAIDSLPSQTLVLIPLYNNRANARLKNGNEANAVQDCTLAIALILGYGAEESATPTIDHAGLDADTALLPSEAKDVNLREHLSKALGRRAKAYEANEKWKLAMGDWSLLLSGGEAFMRGAGGTKLVSEGLTRCRKAVAGESGPPPGVARPPARQTSSAPAKSVARSTVSATEDSGEGVKALRAAAQQQANDDDLRLSLKDGIDARITAWKGGKESNLRALIGSLENVLWPELEWKKVGMHELVSEGQVKVRYVRAIAKVHPDKLNVATTTVEQRMIAGAVFSALNDAWNASK